MLRANENYIESIDSYPFIAARRSMRGWFFSRIADPSLTLVASDDMKQTDDRRDIA
jgi:hypothetical protein